MMRLQRAADDLHRGQTTAKRLVETCLDEIAARNRDLNALLRVYDTEAIQQAEQSDQRRAGGRAKSRFDGLPVVLKANILHRGHVTSAASRMLEDYVAPYDATVVTKLKGAGAIIIGSANMDEFAMGSSGENSAFGATKNPHDLSRVAGGSSSGSAASVAAGFAPLALGSDTGGSIRLPASFCAVVGLKPTYGSVSRWGLIAMASSLDQIGPITKTVADAKAAFELIGGFDRLDSTSQRPPQVQPPPAALTVGVTKQAFDDGVDIRIRTALQKALTKLEAAGCRVIKGLDIAGISEAVAMYYIICPAEVSANMARFDGIRYGLNAGTVTENRTRGFGDEVKRRIVLGTFVLSAGYADKYYRRAMAGRTALKQELERATEGIDAIIGPVAANLAFPLGEKTRDPLSMYLEDTFTILANLVGWPALAVPVGMSSDPRPLPIGLQLMAKPWREDVLFRLGEMIEEVS